MSTKTKDTTAVVNFKVNNEIWGMTGQGDILGPEGNFRLRADEIDLIANQAKSMTGLPPRSRDHQYDLRFFGGGDISVGCQRVTHKHVLRIAKLSQATRNRKK